MSTRIRIIYRIIIAITIEIQSVNAFGINICRRIRGDKSSPNRAIISRVKVVKSGIFVVVISEISDRVRVSKRIVGCLTRDHAIAPRIVVVLHLERTVLVIDTNNVALKIALEISVFKSLVKFQSQHLQQTPKH